jgi:hypothetical protein
MNLVQITRLMSLLLLLWGLVALAMPRQVADMIGLAIEVGSGNGYAEIGAGQGGMSLALGAIGLYAARVGEESGPVLLSALGVIFFGIAFGRLFVALVTSPEAAGVTAWSLAAVEIAMGMVYFLAGRTVDSV